MEDVRRVAAHEVDVCGEYLLNNAVVELSGGHVRNYYTFSLELPFTEWLGGTIKIIRDSDGGLIAYWKGKHIK